MALSITITIQVKKPRHKIPLDIEYVAALKKYAQLKIDAKPAHRELATFRYAAERYMVAVLPSKARRTQEDNRKELAKFYEFFDNPPASLDIEPHHIARYRDWREVTRSAQEIALFSLQCVALMCRAIDGATKMSHVGPDIFGRCHEPTTSDRRSCRAGR